MRKLEFPKTFLWGGGLADFQAEGGYEESGRDNRRQSKAGSQRKRNARQYP
mgnify:CR=1 FL=1